jgi:hypothetical protein
MFARIRFTLSGSIDAARSRCEWSRGQVEARLAAALPDRHGSLCRLSRKRQATVTMRDGCPPSMGALMAKARKTDGQVIAEAAQRPTKKFVATKTADQLDLQALHRACASTPVLTGH